MSKEISFPENANTVETMQLKIYDLILFKIYILIELYFITEL